MKVCQGIQNGVLKIWNIADASIVTGFLEGTVLILSQSNEFYVFIVCEN